MSVCGSVKGSISFGLAISIDTPNREILISGTLVLIFFTTLFFGAIMPRFFNSLKIINDEDLNAVTKQSSNEFSFRFISPNAQDK